MKAFAILPFIVFSIALLVPGSTLLYGGDAQKGRSEAAPLSEDSPLEKGLVKIPEPPLTHLEKAVANQLQDGRKVVDGVVLDSKVDKKKRARAYGDMGQMYHAYELEDAAEACYRNAFFLDPSTFEWGYSLGYLFQETGKYREALDIYNKTKPGKPDLTFLVQVRIGECYAKLNKPAQAKTAFDAAYGINSNDSSILARMGETALAEKKYGEAVKYLEEALAKQPQANQLHYPLGMAYRGLRNREKAKFHISKRGMVGVQPPDPLRTRLANLVTGLRVHTLAGKLAFKAKRYKEAVAAFEKAVESDPKDAGARTNLGTTLGYLKEYKGAVLQFEEALKLDPKNVTVHFNLGTMNRYMGKHAETVKHMTFVVKENPKDEWAYLTLAHAYHQLKKFPEAIKHYNAAIKIEPALVTAWIKLSELYMELKQYDKTLETLNTVSANMPHHVVVSHALARFLGLAPVLKYRDGKRGVKLALKVFETTQNYEHARTVAINYAEAGQCEKAVEWMNKSLEMAVQARCNDSTLAVLKRNLAHFKNKRPCRVPGSQ
ncbi:MAG: tetratricopeptide repeat protein [bacterium]|nr:tetratricopeptide repeat protein [bacterium]